ncbi:GNAT family N-acetyltransferase [Chromobacterium sp. IIBBL 290-4]|uniref:GNAT family N-acetyltransferase n=1 Tax=Chromobacterium sp. IIBBL 290-4 TaxID=2953890 RepID=UPI0020B8CF84|nr:GNAT family N-acetyltransferase [Chromobacterium sp. IIBBL 290-4]UTH74940.1 GNAT family N-acetyltransferase [Chromobacterium sp. IIBBL 290-4]
MSIAIFRPEAADFPDMLSLWERSVRATHLFLSEDDIVALRPEVEAAFAAAESLGLVLRVTRDERGKATGFAGSMAGKLEMLFIEPACRGRGLGKALLTDAVTELAVSLVDVNADNPAALAFYRRMGFEEIGRSALDGAGRPFPLLHLALSDGMA